MFLCGLGRLDFIYLCHHKTRLTFKIRKGHNSTNHTVKFFTRLFTMSQDFMKLCNVIDTDAMFFYNVSFGMTCL